MPCMTGPELQDYPNGELAQTNSFAILIASRHCAHNWHGRYSRHFTLIELEQRYKLLAVTFNVGTSSIGCMEHSAIICKHALDQTVDRDENVQYLRPIL